MQTKSKLLLFVALMLFGLGLATIVNVSLNFREYSIKDATQRATMAAAIVKDGLTAHMVNGIMDKRSYFLNQISSNNDKIKNLWIVRSDKVIKQYGKGFNSETVRDAIDEEVLKTGKTVQKISESTENSMLRITIPYKATVANGPNCLSCHNVQRGDTLGAISMEFDITDMRNAGMFTILKILGINLLFIVIVLLLINHYVTPYMELFSNMQKGIRKAYKGDFSYEFTTKVKGDAKNIVDQLNTLFRKMQETFGDIKYNLATFIPQGCVSSSDPLHEAKTIIGELSDIYKFKKTIEHDLTKEIVYQRIVDVLSNKYELSHFAFYEIDTLKATRKLIYISNGKSVCNDKVDEEASLCRAHRTNTAVISSEFVNLCRECSCEGLEYICIPFTINDENSLVISITTKEKNELNRVNSFIKSIENYLEAAKPVIESKILMSKLRDTSLRDAMTGLYNRRFLEEFIDTFANQAKRDNTTYSVLMLDVDFFKKVNDTYGHDVGDKVIAKIGEVLRSSIRESDLAIRYGGEEFVVLLHNATDEGTKMIASKIHSEFSKLVFDVGNGKTIQKTMSIGISKFPKDGDTIWKCIKYADTALYVAKTTGRNKIVEYKPEMSEDEHLR
ncbi:GGDEF domain-containing protein [Sulfurimonas sp. SWIR-19]|uniref:GGDEF domain-containing protein n=1 Tax=Sulfurimonas sp. SWIR-19 TaxID=2878390 RepID=UPI001CF1D6E7|nr:GGDEF domain-containing protein [Sulfurimonas sp. SWIR-19]UCN01103.1 GGDEF domain-containing protein [Sulfurimonas sp. SWIR-19]